MSVAQHLEFAHMHLRSTAALCRSGLSERGIAAGVRAGHIVQLRPGWYIEHGVWELLRSEQRQLVALAAAQQAGLRDRVYSHRSAAALHGLPAWSGWMRGAGAEPLEFRGLHVLVAPRSAASAHGRLIRHQGRLGAHDVVQKFGLRCTSVRRTLFDVARTEPFPVALACADAALRRATVRDRRVDDEAWAHWRQEMLERAFEHRGSRGIRAARTMVLLADPRAESPLESVSRLRFLQVGIHVEPQVAIPAENGGTLYLDFVLAGQGIFGECDGKAKYVDPSMTAGMTPNKVFETERRRHNWICGTTGMRGVRWGADAAITVGRFAARLRAFGVELPGSAVASFGAETAMFLDRLST